MNCNRLAVPKHPLHTVLPCENRDMAEAVAGMEEISVEIEEPFSMLPIETITAKARSDIVTLVNGQLVNDCATDTVVGNAMAGAPAPQLNSMERPKDLGMDAPDTWLKPSWATID